MDKLEYQNKPCYRHSSNNTVYFGTLISPFSTKSLLCLHGFLLTQLFFQSLKKQRNQRTACTLYISKHIIFISAVTNAVSWRTDGVKYRKNEVFLDVIESVNLLAGASGNVLRSEIVGAIKMRVYLSGMPELRLGLNDKVLFESTGRGKSKSVELEDTKFHQCVRLSRFDNDRTISFIPPDGEFELMSYRLNTHVS